MASVSLEQALALGLLFSGYDPALVLEIPGEERNYSHLIAAWEVGNEYPIKKWLAEYTE